MRNISSIIGGFVRTVSLCLILSLSLSVSVFAQDDIKEGETLYKSKCTSCHALDRHLVGPALEGMSERHPDEEWLVSWIRNSQQLIQDGDEVAVQLFEENNRMVMTAFTDLSDEQIKNIIAYVDAETAGGGDEEQGDASQIAASQDKGISPWMIIGVIAIAAVAIAIVLVLNRAIQTLEKLVEANKDAIAEAAEEESDRENRFLVFAKAFVKNKKLVFFFVLMVVAILGVVGWKVMWNVGVHEGYMPVQPIKFSHRIHAGVNQIDCQYCHGGAYESRNASIPSANVCMNCHTTITGADHYDGSLSPEIAKIYKAVDYDPDTREYGDNPKPIEWVRVHNLPDFAYFNHSQHVSVANVDCETCHGPVEAMEEMYQYSPLTMKWCVECHQETSVDMDNEYYDQLIEAHEKLKKGEKMTAAMIGGLECGKCHY